MQFVPHYAPLVILMFLGACLGFCVLGLLLAFGLLRRKYALARFAFLLALAGAGLYGGLLLGFSFFSAEVTLRPGELKYFCEVDCHLAYSVEDVATTKTLGNPNGAATAAGTFYVVKLRTWFDPKTTARWRPKEIPLIPPARRVVIVDAEGRRYWPSLAGLNAARNSGDAMIPMTTPLRPGESFTTTLVFDLPAGVEKPRLLLTDEDPVTFLLIGHESSIFHKQIFFALTAHTGAALRVQP